MTYLQKIIDLIGKKNIVTSLLAASLASSSLACVRSSNGNQDLSKYLNLEAGIAYIQNPQSLTQGDWFMPKVPSSYRHFYILEPSKYGTIDDTKIEWLGTIDNSYLLRNPGADVTLLTESSSYKAWHNAYSRFSPKTIEDFAILLYENTTQNYRCPKYNNQDVPRELLALAPNKLERLIEEAHSQDYDAAALWKGLGPLNQQNWDRQYVLINNKRE